MSEVLVMDMRIYTKHWENCIDNGIEPYAYAQLLDGICVICASCYLPIKNDEIGKAEIAGESAHVKCAEKFLKQF
jgi:hypothetical protein